MRATSTSTHKPAPPRKRRLFSLALVMIATASLAPALWTLAYRFAPPPATMLMAQRAAEGLDVRRQPVALTAISPHLVRAVIAAEDARFCGHAGMDFAEIARALREAERGKRLRGASTISQQTAKNVFLWGGRSWLRKAMESYFTIALETLWPKRRIMEVYLNAIEWGDGIFGAEAAAKARFGKAAKDLTAREAALLAAVLPNPHKWRVDPPGPYVRRRAATLQARMRVVAAEGRADCALPMQKKTE